MAELDLRATSNGVVVFQFVGGGGEREMGNFNQGSKSLSIAARWAVSSESDSGQLSSHSR